MSTKKIKLIIFLLILILLFFAFYKWKSTQPAQIPVTPPVSQPNQFNNQQTAPAIPTVALKGKEIKVKIADTSKARAQGLSGTSPLKDDEGMFFIFEQPGQYGFWMKDMNYPIDIVWFDENYTVVYIKKDARPELYPEIYTPNMNSKYVIELPSLWSTKNNLRVGDKAIFYP